MLRAASSSARRSVGRGCSLFSRPSRRAWSRWKLAEERIIGRELAKLGHIVRLIPPAYVKPFVKRHKNDAADAEAICEAAQRPSMRFVPVKSEEQQASAVVFRARDLLVRQRTQCINALRGHLTEYGWVIPKGVPHVARLIERVEDPGGLPPEGARAILSELITTLRALDEQIAGLDAEIVRRAKADLIVRRLMTIPGVGPMTATAIVALAPPPETFRPAATSRPGWGLRHCRSRPEASISSAPSPRWASGRCGACSPLEPAPW